MMKVHSIREPKQQAPMVRWVPVTDAAGRTRMEMRWHVAGVHRTSRAA